MIKTSRWVWRGTEYLLSLKVFPTSYLLMTEEKQNFTVDYASDHSFNQCSTLRSPRLWQCASWGDEAFMQISRQRFWFSKAGWSQSMDAGNKLLRGSDVGDPQTTDRLLGVKYLFMVALQALSKDSHVCKLLETATGCHPYLNKCLSSIWQKFLSA